MFPAYIEKDKEQREREREREIYIFICDTVELICVINNVFNSFIQKSLNSK